MAVESFTQGARQKAWGFGFTSFLLINVGACIPDPAAPWHPAQPLLRNNASPSLAVPRPSGSSFPVGLMAISHARTSSAVGALPSPYVGPCAQAVRQDATTAAIGRTLGQAIEHAPVARDLPGLNAVVGALHPEVFIQGLVPVFSDFGARGLNRTQVVGAARHQDALFSVPLPGIAEARVRHGQRGRAKLGVLPGLAGIEGDLNAADRSRAGPRQSGDFVDAGAGELLSAGRKSVYGFRTDHVGQSGDLGVRVDVP